MRNHDHPRELERLPAPFARHLPRRAHPATSESEKISFNQLNPQTGHRIKYLKVDADTGEEVPNEDIVKGYQLEKDQFIEVSKEELEEIALESTRTIEIDEFVEKTDIDPRYLIRPYYIRPDGKVGHDAFAVIRSIWAPSSVRLMRSTVDSNHDDVAIRHQQVARRCRDAR
ncbi:Ku protein [Bradyrhizobium sp. GM22.5]